MDDQQHAASHVSPFEAIKKQAEDGSEYWSARDLSKILGYTLWQKFRNVIQKAEKACENSREAVSDHFIHADKMISAGKGAQRKIEDIYLSRYGAYLAVQNGDSSKPIVALGQTYFAVQTRRKELDDEFETLPEDQKRLIMRSMLTTFHLRLAQAAQRAGVIDPQDFATFYDHGYMGLYGGLRENDIHVRKGLTEDHQKISDYMGSEELGANIFRATQTDPKLRRDQVNMKEQANSTHYQVGQEVRETIKRLGGTMPEDLPTPAESIQELQRKDQKQVQQRQQPSLFDKSSDDND